MSRGEGADAPTGRPGRDGGGGLKAFRCGDVVPGCRASFRGSEAHVLELVGAHGERDHGLRLTPDLVGAVLRAMRPA